MTLYSSCAPTMEGTTTTFMPAATAPCIGGIYIRTHRSVCQEFCFHRCVGGATGQVTDLGNFPLLIVIMVVLQALNGAISVDSPPSTGPTRPAHPPLETHKNTPTNRLTSTPLGASSKQRHWLGSTPSCCAAATNTSGAGLPLVTCCVFVRRSPGRVSQPDHAHNKHTTQTRSKEHLVYLLLDAAPATSPPETSLHSLVLPQPTLSIPPSPSPS